MQLPEKIELKNNADAFIKLIWEDHAFADVDEQTFEGLAFIAYTFCDPETGETREVAKIDQVPETLAAEFSALLESNRLMIMPGEAFTRFLDVVGFDNLPNREAEHAVMVTRLIKPGSDLHETSAPAKWSLVHAALGISGEVAEIENLDDEQEHLLEESGDLLFYCRDLRIQLKLPALEVRHGSLPIVWWAGVITDVVKKVAIYGQDMTEERRDKIRVALDAIENTVNARLSAQGYTRLDALRHNVKKLWKGAKARYATGTYSDKAAADRADKEGES